MENSFSGKTVVVTGAGRGIGKAIAQAFAEAGARVVLWSRSEGPLEDAVEELRVLGFDVKGQPCDVSSRADVERVSAAISGAIDVLVNNAGISGDEVSCLDIPEEDWDRMLATNLKGPFLCSQTIGRRMREAGGGAIVNIASISGLGMDGPLVHYSASKAGLLALTRGMAVELAPYGIRVNALSPGYIRTEMTTSYFGPELDNYLNRDFRRVPMRRLIEPREVADAAVYLSSARASAITGANLVVDGGLTGNLFILESIPRQESLG